MLNFKICKTVIFFKSKAFIYSLNFLFLNSFCISGLKDDVFLFPLVDKNYLKVKSSYKQL